MTLVTLLGTLNAAILTSTVAIVGLALDHVAAPAVAAHFAVRTALGRPLDLALLAIAATGTIAAADLAAIAALGLLAAAAASAAIGALRLAAAALVDALGLTAPTASAAIAVSLG